ncbi:MAG: hypothetical protein GY754_03690 [bacterium]|nr:hypothetical protein [bacterium]
MKKIIFSILMLMTLLILGMKISENTESDFFKIALYQRSGFEVELWDVRIISLRDGNDYKFIPYDPGKYDILLAPDTGKKGTSDKNREKAFQTGTPLEVALDQCGPVEPNIDTGQSGICVPELVTGPMSMSHHAVHAKDQFVAYLCMRNAFRNITKKKGEKVTLTGKNSEWWKNNEAFPLKKLEYTQCADLEDVLENYNACIKTHITEKTPIDQSTVIDNHRFYRMRKKTTNRWFLNEKNGSHLTTKVCIDPRDGTQGNKSHPHYGNRTGDASFQVTYGMPLRNLGSLSFRQETGKDKIKKNSSGEKNDALSYWDIAWHYADRMATKCTSCLRKEVPGLDKRLNQPWLDETVEKGANKKIDKTLGPEFRALFRYIYFSWLFSWKDYSDVIEGDNNARSNSTKFSHPQLVKVNQAKLTYALMSLLAKDEKEDKYDLEDLVRFTRYAIYNENAKYKFSLKCKTACGFKAKREDFVGTKPEELKALRYKFKGRFFAKYEGKNEGIDLTLENIFKMFFKKNLKNEREAYWESLQVYFSRLPQPYVVFDPKDEGNLQNRVISLAVEDRVSVSYRLMEEEKVERNSPYGKHRTFCPSYNTTSDAKIFITNAEAYRRCTHRATHIRKMSIDHTNVGERNSYTWNAVKDKFGIIKKDMERDHDIDWSWED